MTAADFAKRMACQRADKRAVAKGAAELVRNFSDRRTGRQRGNSNVLRGSKHAGEYERQRWRRENVFGRAEKEARLKCIRRWSQRQRKPGRAYGPITPKKFAILEYLYNSRDYRDGRLEPSYSEIRGALAEGACNQTISDAFNTFGELDLMEKQRRTVPVENPEPGGQTNTQIPSALFLKLPPDIEAMVRKELGQIAVAMKTEPRPREPGEYEARQIAALMTAKPGETPAEAARREHLLQVAIERQNVRANAGKHAGCNSGP